MRPLLITPLLLLAACDAAGSSEQRARMDACGDARQPDAAIAACDRLLGQEGLSDDARAFALHGRGRAAMEKQDMAAALRDLNGAIRLDPDRSGAFAMRGIVHGTRGDMEAAIADFSRAIELDPEDAATFQNRGKSYSDTGRQQRAVQDFSRAIALGNDEAATRNGRCWARAVLGEELELAREDCEAAVRMEPEDANTLNSLAFVHFRSGDHAGAVEHYTASLSRNPKGASSYYMRGRAKAELGDATASADIAKGLELEPGVAQRYAGYGIAP